LTLDGAIGGIEHALLPDLKQELASVVRILLDHARRGTTDPHIVVFVEATAVEARIEKLGIAPGVDQITRRIELNQRGGQVPRVHVPSQHGLPIEDEPERLCSDTYSAHPSK